MSEEIKIDAQTRETSGSSAARRIRRTGMVPAILSKVGGGTSMVALNAHDFERMLGKHLSEQLVLTLNVDGTPKLVLLREIQRSGLTGKVIHADFGEIAKDHKLHVRIPVVVIGEPEGVRTGGGILEQMLRVIDVACLPADIVDKFEIDVSAMVVGANMLVKDLNLGDKFTVLTHGETTVATVQLPQAEDDTAAATAEGDGTAPAMPELVEKKGKADEAAEEPAKKDAGKK